MAAIRSPGDQNVADDTANSSTGNENSLALPPDAVYLVEESLVVVDATELAPAGIRSIGF